MRNWEKGRWGWKRAVRADRTIGDGAKLLACTLVDELANHKTALCRHKMEAIANELGKSIRSTQRAIADLKKADWITVKQVRGSKDHKVEFFFHHKFENTPDVAGETTAGTREIERESVTKSPPIEHESCDKTVVTLAKSCDTSGNSCDKTVVSPCTPYNDKPTSNQNRAEVSEKKPVAVQQFRNHRFSDNPMDGLSIIAAEKLLLLNDWSEWLRVNGFPKLYQLPIQQRDKKSGKVYFWLPTQKPPSTPETTADVRNFFSSLIDMEATRHAAQ